MTLVGGGVEEVVLFSSIASLFGSPGQLNYSGANAALDAVATLWKQQGIGSVSVQWGAWSGSGMAARDPSTARRMERMGIGLLQAEDGLAALGRIVGDRQAVQVAVSPMLWETFVAQPYGLPEEFLQLYRGSKRPVEVAPQRSAPAPVVDAPMAVVGAAPAAVASVEEEVMEAVEGILGREVGRVEPLVAAGLDSLGAVELTSSMEERFGVRLPATLLFDYPTVEDLSAHMQAVLPRPQPGAGAIPPAGQAAAVSRPVREDLQRRIAGVVQELLGVEVDVSEPLAAAGVDSLGAVELRSSLESELEMQLPATLLFDFPTICDLAAHLGQIEGPPELAAAAPGLGLIGALEQEQATTWTGIHALAARLPYDVLGAGAEQDCVAVVPLGRWDVEGRGQEGTASRYGVWLPEVCEFDGTLFGVSGSESALMDPQQRLLMELGWEAVQGCGAAEVAAGSDWGVYVGIWHADYHAVVGGASRKGYVAYHATGTNSSVAAGRLSYTFGLKGPSLSLDTACSASLVAAHLAHNGILGGESQAALVCGVSLLLEPELVDILVSAQMLSSCGRCQTLSAEADGYGRGEASITLVLGRAGLGMGEVCSLMRGSAVNQDGRSSSLTAPNGPAQQAVLQTAWGSGGVEVAAMKALCMHGTGTALGDPIEAGAATAVVGASRGRQPVSLQAAKSSVSHSEAAAGLMGMVFGMLPERSMLVTALTHLREMNKYVEAVMGRREDGSAVWSAPRQGGGTALAREAVCVGTSSFAYMGTNAHVVVGGAGAGAKQARESRLAAWVRARSYVLPAAHYVLERVGGAVGGGEVVLEGMVGGGRLAFLWDHKVCFHCTGSIFCGIVVLQCYRNRFTLTRWVCVSYRCWEMQYFPALDLWKWLLPAPDMLLPRCKEQLNWRSMSCC